MMFAKKYNKFVLVLILTLTIITAMLSSTGAVAFAQDNESVVYSDVLEDLHKDSTFDESNYPVKEKDYSLSVIQLAEGVNKELFVYVYQPSGIQDMHASSINISTTINDDISFYNYKLEYINSKTTFFKYKVKGFTVREDSARYYAISSIFRPFNSAYGDIQASGGNTITEVNYDISRQYEFGEINGKPYVNCVDIETIVITDKFVGFVRYPDGFKLYVGACDSHFVAFNTDKPIDKLLEADVYYTKQNYNWSLNMFSKKSETFGDKSDEYAYLKYTDKVEHTGGGIHAGTYTWDRIQSMADFKASVDFEQNVYSGAFIDVKVASKLTDEARTELEGKKWVLRFTETPYHLYSSATSGNTWGDSTIVGDVTILRLKFEFNGKTYNLGTIDNKQTGSKDPVNDTETKVTVSNGLQSFWNKFLEALKWIGVAIGVIIGLVLLYFVIRLVLKLTEPLRERAKERRTEKRLEKKQSKTKGGNST